MKLVFLDESGYSRNWLNDIESQPFYVLSAVAIDASHYAAGCDDLRKCAADLKLPQHLHLLGKGSEIKARQVTNGQGWWREHNLERKQFLDCILSMPNKLAGVVFVVVIDKAELLKKYAEPADPVQLAMQFLFERLEFYLRGIEDYAYCVYDHDKARTDSLNDQSIELIRDGSSVEFYSSFYRQKVNRKHELLHILEMALGSSENSVGLQMADFFATCTYTYFRDKKPADCGWWPILSAALYRENGKLDGFGLKVFPING